MNRRELIKGLLTTAVAAVSPASSFEAPIVRDAVIAFTPSPDAGMCLVYYWTKSVDGLWHYYEHTLQECGQGKLVKIYRDGALMVHDFTTDDVVDELYNALRRRAEQG